MPELGSSPARLRLVHLSDLHLGFRQYQRLTPGGINQREADVARTVRACDRPGDRARARARRHRRRRVSLGPADAIRRSFTPFLQFARLHRRCPHAAIVMIAGNHDTPRSSETGDPAALFAPARAARRRSRSASASRFPQLDLSVLAVPDVPASAARARCPIRRSRYNVLLLHGEVRGDAAGRAATPERAAMEIPQDELRRPHGTTSRSATITCTANRAERVLQRLDRLHELQHLGRAVRGAHLAGVPGKGFIERDLATGAHTFHPLPAARGSSSTCRRSSARGMTAAEIDEQIRDAVDGVRRRDRRQGRAARGARRAAPRRRASSTTRRCASTSGARCTSISTSAARRSTRDSTSPARRAAAVARRHRAREAARAPADAATSTATRSSSSALRYLSEARARVASRRRAWREDG